VADTTYGAPIPINTPQGLRAKQTVDMLNSDWPIGTVGVRTMAAPQEVNGITSAMGNLWLDRPITVAGIEIGAGLAKLHVLTSYGVAQDIELRTNAEGLVDRFDVSLQPPAIKSWQDIDTELAKSGARYSYQVSKVVPDGPAGKCVSIAGTNTDVSLPLASIFKLYVLLAVADAVKAGTLNWTDELTITQEAKAVGSAGLDELPPGAQVSVRKAAQQMISASDNMATDLLIARLEPGAVERALVTAGHHDPASMTPFPTMHELFSIGWGTPDLREQWKQASPEGRAQLLQQTNSRPYQPDPTRTNAPASAYGAEWYGSAADICRVHAALQAAAVGRAAPVKDILSSVAGIDLDESQWPYIGAKAGNLPGDMTFSWYAVDRTGQPWVVSFQANWSQFRSNTAAGWLLSIAKQAFGLIPIA
jgi:beta-lactamase class A